MEESMKTNARLTRGLSFAALVVLLFSLVLVPASAQEAIPVLAISGGDNQSACIGTAYALPLQVTVTDGVLPVAGAVVEFTAPSSGASIVPATFTATTDAGGVASATVTANASVGAVDVYASYGGQTMLFQLTNTPVLVVAIAGGDDQSAVIETAYALPLQVQVTNLGVPVAGAVIEFVAPKHPGVAGLTLDRFSATTDANGVASAAVTANEYPGAIEVSASYSGQTVVFHLTNLVQPPILSSAPYVIEPRCEFVDNVFAHDPAADGNSRVCLSQTNPAGCAKYNYCWWRDTTDQNALAQNTNEQFSGTVYQPYSSSKLKVMFYSTLSEANVVALVGTDSWYLIDAGGGRDEANAAKMAFQAFYPTFSTKKLKGIILTSIDTQVTWGGQFWRNAFRTVPPAPIYASSEYFSALERTEPVLAETMARDEYAYGRNLTWGEDSFLGLGSGRIYNPLLPFYVSPSVFIEEETTLSLDGSVPITLIPTLSETGGLSVWLPDQKILIPTDLFGRFLPPIAPLNGRYIPIEQAMEALDLYVSLDPVLWLPMHTMYISGEDAIDAALGVEKDALNAINTQTLTYINQHQHVDDGDDDSSSSNPGYAPDLDLDGAPDDHDVWPQYDVDDIVNMVQLPANLASSPYARETAGSVASIVRAVYHENVGWFDRDPVNLWTFSSLEHARRMIDMAGGAPGALQYARKCLTEHTRAGAQMALEVAGNLRQVSPSDDANDIYIQALKMLGWTTPNAPERNWYLMEAYEVEMGQQ
jgi:glyoxylase-like metal-dependent hydrolase (beta-lactamase superfamily II)